MNTKQIDISPEGGQKKKQMQMQKIDAYGRELPPSMFWNGKSYYLSFWANGRTNLKKVGRTFTEAKAAQRKILSQRDAGEYTPIKNIRFSELCERWLTTRANAKPSTVEHYKAQIERRLKPRFGQLQTRAISSEMIDLFVADLLSPESKLSPRTVCHTLTVLKGIFRVAEKWGYVHRSPAAAVEKPRVPRVDIEFYNPSEIARLLDAADDSHYPILLTLAMTGVRKAELLGLSWDDVDFEAGNIYVRYQAKGGKRVELKSNKSKRLIPMPSILIKTLKEHQLRQVVEGVANQDGWLFPSEAGTPLDPTNFLKRIFWPTIARAGLHRLTPHSLRHSFATIRLCQGDSLADVSAWLGHADVSVTASVYTHYLPRKRTDEPDKLEAAIFGQDKVRI